MDRGYGYTMHFGPPVTPQIIKQLMIANAAVFAAQFLIPPLTPALVVSPEGVWIQRQVWRAFTYMWLHHVSVVPLHLAINMFMLWMFGSELALHWGERRFLQYYLACGVGAGLLIATVPFLPGLLGGPPLTEELAKTTLGASGAVMGVLLAFSFTWPYRTIQLLFPPIPIRAIWLIPLVLGLDLVFGSSNVSHLGHLGGALVGWIYLVREGKTPGVPTPASFWRRLRRRKGPPPKSEARIRVLGEPPRKQKPSLRRRLQRRRARRRLRAVPRSSDD